MILKLETYTEMGPRCLFRYFEVSFTVRIFKGFFFWKLSQV